MGLVMAITNYGDINLSLLAKFCFMNHNIRITNMCYKD